MFGPIRYETIDYRYEIPSIHDLQTLIERSPTMQNVSTISIQPGFVTWDNVSIWICMGVEPSSTSLFESDVHWVYMKREEGQVTHIQQTFSMDGATLWQGTFVTLKEKTREGHCPYCHTKLEWASMAERCPSCWWVKL